MRKLRLGDASEIIPGNSCSCNLGPCPWKVGALNPCVHGLPDVLIWCKVLNTPYSSSNSWAPFSLLSALFHSVGFDGFTHPYQSFSFSSISQSKWQKLRLTCRELHCHFPSVSAASSSLSQPLNVEVPQHYPLATLPSPLVTVVTTTAQYTKCISLSGFQVHLLYYTSYTWLGPCG